MIAWLQKNGHNLNHFQEAWEFRHKISSLSFTVYDLHIVQDICAFVYWYENLSLPFIP